MNLERYPIKYQRGFHWETIDKSGDPTHFVRFMDEIREYRDDDPEQYLFFTYLLALEDGGRVLDLGCGTGGTTRVLVRQHSKLRSVIGLDISYTMLSVAKQRAVYPNPQLNYVQGSIGSIPFRNSTFDACYSIGLFDILSFPRDALLEVSRVTRNGGQIVITAPDVDAMTIDSSNQELTRRIIHFYCDRLTNGWMGRQLSGYLKDAGLRVEKTEAYTTIVEDYSRLHKLWFRDALNYAQVEGVLETVEADAWLDDIMNRQAAGRFFASFTTFVSLATKTD